MPAFVSVTPVKCLSNSVTPSFSSRVRTRRLTAECLTPSARAAALKLRCSATASPCLIEIGLMADRSGGPDDGLRRDMSVLFLSRPQILGRGELDLVVFCFVKPEDAEAFRDGFARNCPRRLIGTTEPKTMNAPYRDQSMKVTVHFAPCEDGGLMVWSERWRAD